ncbi:MAG: YveK family protein [Candidatus Roseilinea sp.]|uniref:YveK family protein n=1 Tax=Candidatus Roseilinea sp. TaxID=2838777 RepID=UPI00404A886B
MRLIDYARVFLRWWWLGLLPVVVVAAVTAITYRPPAVSYRVTMRFSTGLLLDRPSDVYTYDRYYEWLASEYLTNGLKDVVRTGVFAEAVSARMMAAGQPIPASQIQGAIASDHAQSIFVVYVTWPDAAQAVELARAIAAELSENSAAYWPQLAEIAGSPVRLLDRPAPAPVAASLRDQLDPIVRLAVALASGVALTFVAHFFDPTVRDPRDLERAGLRVIGCIPSDNR